MKRLKQNSHLANRPMDLGKLLILSLKGKIQSKFSGKKIAEFPDEISDFKFQKEFRKISIKKSFKLGIYENSKGQKAMAKIWAGYAKDFNYYTFRNEIYMYEILNKTLDRLGKKIPSKYENMKIPKLIAVIEEKNQCLILLEFVEGEVASKLSSKDKLKVYLKTVDFIIFLGNHVSKTEKNKISERKGLHYILLYPLVLSKALIASPHAITSLIKGIYVFTKSLPILLKENYSSLTHRDLHFDNILVSEKYITLIDLQFCVYTEPLYELITTLRYRWLEDDFHLLLLSYIKKNYNKKGHFKNMFRALSVMSVTHGLSDNSFTKLTRNNWINFMKYSLSNQYI